MSPRRPVRTAVEWETIHDADSIVIQVASKETMLVMKLRANRPRRDTRDIRLLLALCNVHTLEDAGELYDDFYPGDILVPRAEKMNWRLARKTHPLGRLSVQNAGPF